MDAFNIRMGNLSENVIQLFQFTGLCNWNSIGFDKFDFI